MASASPTVRRRELGARLRALRTDAGMTVDDVAARMEVSPAKISRIETGARGVSVADVRYLCDLYQVSTDERERLLNLTRESKRRSWWQEYGLPDVGRDLRRPGGRGAVHPPVRDEPGAGDCSRRESYASALDLRHPPRTSTREVEQLVQARLTRQALLSGEPPPESGA